MAPAPAPGEAVEHVLGDSPVVIREKTHEAHPMTVDDALYEMEMVGHDFYLFIDAETAQPSVAYRRHGWSYGVIKLDTPVARASGGASNGVPSQATAGLDRGRGRRLTRRPADAVARTRRPADVTGPRAASRPARRCGAGG